MAKAVSAGALTLEINGNDAGLQKAVASSEQKLTRMERAFSRLRSGVTSSASTIGEKFNTAVVSLSSFSLALQDYVVNPLRGALQGFSQMGYALEDMSRRARMSVEQLGAIGYAAEQSGARTEDVAAAFEALGEKMDLARRGNADAMMQIYRASGLTYAQLKEMNPRDQFLAVADAIGQVERQADRMKLLRDMFGSDALLSMIEKGRAGMEALFAEAQTLGAPWSRENVENSKRLANAWNRIKTVLAGMRDSFLSEMADSIIALLQNAEKFIVRVKTFVNAHKTLIKVATIGVAALTAFVTATGLLSTAFTLLTAVFTPFLSVLAAFLSPWLAIPALIVGAVAALAMFSESFRSALAEIVRFCFSGFSYLVDFFSDALKLIGKGDISGAFRNLWVRVQIVFLDGVEAMNKIWGGFLSGLIGFFRSFCSSIFGDQHALGDEVGADVANLGDFIISIWYGISKGLINIWYGLKKVWSSLVAQLRSVWVDYNTWWEKRMNEMMGRIYGVDDHVIRQLNKAADETNAQKKSDIDVERKAAIDAADAENKEVLEILKADVSTKLEDRQKDRAVRAAQREEKRAALQRELDEKRRELEREEERPLESQLEKLGSSSQGGNGGAPPLFMLRYEQGQSLVTRNAFQAADGGGESAVQKQIEIAKAQLEMLQIIGEELAGV
ncbi:MAG: hypothetical protein Q4D38_13940 [Planctomycetia bacterium]|nr:hypothetical protein [Planctomycetia bacterium]